MPRDPGVHIIWDVIQTKLGELERAANGLLEGLGSGETSDRGYANGIRRE